LAGEGSELGTNRGKVVVNELSRGGDESSVARSLAEPDFFARTSDDSGINDVGGGDTVP
jgi:hypothetical protein